ncbi:MAG: hypothetical protein IKS25_01095 [Oscillospiraceae bacterium]|nr:hypothetical protein [Oscillospiraceae bacterium]
MIELYVNNQTLRLYTPVIAADTLRYLTGVVHFSGDAWDGYNKWVHFLNGEGAGAPAYDILLTDDAFTEAAELNLTVGEWTVYVTGVKGTSRLTTVPVIMTVKASGLVDAPLHAMPMSVAEQIDSKASTALSFAAAVRDAALRGDFNGQDGTSFTIKGFFDTYADMSAAVASPVAGEAYGVGTAAPYDIYIWDEVNSAWKNNGPIQGAKGNTGDPGAVFTPSVDASGNLSWTNNGGLENPETRNITGPTGATGAAGADGKGPYEAAVEAGYSGTEATFNTALVAIPYHNARHLPTGADPITVLEDNIGSLAVTEGKIGNGAVTQAKLAAHAVSTVYSATITTSWADTDGAAPYSQSITVSGLLSTDTLLIDIDPSGTYATAEAELDAWAEIYRFAVADNTLTVYAKSAATTAVPIKILAVRR